MHMIPFSDFFSGHITNISFRVSLILSFFSNNHKGNKYTATFNLTLKKKPEFFFVSYYSPHKKIFIWLEKTIFIIKIEMFKILFSIIDDVCVVLVDAVRVVQKSEQNPITQNSINTK